CAAACDDDLALMYRSGAAVHGQRRPHLGNRTRGSLNLLVGFVPFGLFTVLARLSVDLALWLSFATAFAIGMRGFLKHRVLRFFDLGSTVVFGFLAMFCGFFEPGLQISAIRLIVDISLFAIAFASLVARQPFTLQYAPGNVEADVLDRPSFIR